MPHPRIVVAPCDRGYLAYDVDRNRLHRLNPTAALILELCNGQRTREEVLNTLAPLVGPGDVTHYHAWLDQACDQGLLLERSSSLTAAATEHDQSPPKPLTAPELSAISVESRHQGRVLAAYLCQRRAVELAPEDDSAWYTLAELAHIVGRRDEARSAYERYSQIHPEDVEVAHLLVALRDEQPPPRASDEYVEQLYSYFASFYDDNMCRDLDYRAPDLLNQALRVATGDQRAPRFLELGCGTGLFGELVRPWADQLTGLDLSAAMIERARQRGIYDQLETAEITHWLAQPAPMRYTVIAACDTLIYFGDLRQVLPSARNHLAEGGLIGFTVESGTKYPFLLSDSGRFQHHADHVLEVARESGFDLESLAEEVIRYEYGEEVIGLVTVLRRTEG